MISLSAAEIALAISFLVTIVSYLILSRLERSYINILSPSLIINAPAYYIFPWIYVHAFGTDATPYAFWYVYVALACENVAFVYGYSLAKTRIIRLPFRFAYRNFALLSFACLGIAVLVYIPLLIEFREYLFDPRQIYTQTRTGFGPQFYISSILAYLAVILIIFSKRPWLVKAAVVVVAAGLLMLHGSKGQVLNLLLLLILFQVYGAGKKVGFWRAVMFCSAIVPIALLLFAATMYLGEGPQEMLESISQYSDYTRNAMMVIDAHLPVRYGRLTFEANTLALVPRALMPNKPKNFGAMRLDEEFYPEQLDADAGAPAFGIGVQFADFGDFAIIYVALFALLRGWLGRIFVNRLRATHHPADFFMLAFLADLSLFPVGGLGWFLPGALLMVILLRFTSILGATNTYSELRSSSFDLSAAAPASLPEPRSV